MRKYEGTYMLPDSLQDKALENACTALKSEIEKLGGIVHEVKQPSSRTFPRRLKRCHTGYYIGITFELAPDKVHALQERNKLDANILRVMITSARKQTGDVA